MFENIEGDKDYCRNYCKHPVEWKCTIRKKISCTRYYPVSKSVNLITKSELALQT